MDIIISLLRYIAPVFALIILLTCIISLFRNRPRIHTLARLIDCDSGTIINIDHWETSIGKSNSNDVVLPYPAISRFHAVISKKRKEWIIADTSFRSSGVIVNDHKIDKRCIIENDDIITIGSVKLKFSCDEAVSQQKKKEIRKTTMTQNTNIAYGVLVDIKTKKPVYLKKKNVVIGRSNDCDIQLISQMVSAHHARIYQTQKGWALVDLDSHNGTKINGRYISEPQLIFDEDMLSFGDKVFIFYDK